MLQELQLIKVNKKEQTFLARQPFDVQKVIDFCGSKWLAKKLLLSLGEALLCADGARNRGESDDVEFETMFWDGTLFLSEDDDFDLGILSDDFECYTPEVCAVDAELDAEICLAIGTNGSRFISVDWQFNAYVSSWWLTREDKSNWERA